MVRHLEHGRPQIGSGPQQHPLRGRLDITGQQQTDPVHLCGDHHAGVVLGRAGCAIDAGDVRRSDSVAG
jgi:hypothetical protein